MLTFTVHEPPNPPADLIRLTKAADQAAAYLEACLAELDAPKPPRFLLHDVLPKNL